MTSLSEIEYVLDYVRFKIFGLTDTEKTLEKKIKDVLTLSPRQLNEYITEDDITIINSLCKLSGKTKFIHGRILSEFNMMIQAYKKGGMGAVYVLFELTDGFSVDQERVLLIRSDLDKEIIDFQIDSNSRLPYIIYNGSLFKEVSGVEGKNAYVLTCSSFIFQIMLDTKGMVVKKKLKELCRANYARFSTKLEVPKKVYTLSARYFYGTDDPLTKYFKYDGVKPGLYHTDKLVDEELCRQKAQSKIKVLKQEEQRRQKAQILEIERKYQAQLRKKKTPSPPVVREHHYRRVLERNPYSMYYKKKSPSPVRAKKPTGSRRRSR